MKRHKNSRREIKDGIEEDIARDYTWEQAKTVLKLEGLDERDFADFMVGQTVPVVEVNGKRELGVYGYDLFRYIQRYRK